MVRCTCFPEPHRIFRFEIEPDTDIGYRVRAICHPCRRETTLVRQWGWMGDKLVVGARSDDTSGAVHLFANAGQISRG